MNKTLSIIDIRGVGRVKDTSKKIKTDRFNVYIFMCYILTFDPAPKMLFLGDTPEGSDTFQWPVIERDRVGGLRLMIWDKVKVSLCHYSHAPEESNL